MSTIFPKGKSILGDITKAVFDWTVGIAKSHIL